MSPLGPDLYDRHLVPFDGQFDLSDFSTKPPSGTPDEDELKDELEDLTEELYDLQRVLYADERYAVLAVFQAMDAGGKDSTIRHVFSGVNPAGFRVNAFEKPSDLELRHDFLWRCANRLPERGRIGIFNRSHYEEVLVVRVHPGHLEKQHLPAINHEDIWENRFESIRNFEQHLARNGTIVVKFWLNVSREEQKARFMRRIERDDKNWKFSIHDLDDRARWSDYMHAYEEALRATSRPCAPWYAIPADDKPYMRWVVAKTMVHTLKNLDIAYPDVGEEQEKNLERGRRLLDAEEG